MSNRWALVEGGVVTAVVVQASVPTVPGTWVDVTALAVGPGFALSGESWVPVPPPAAAVTRAQLQAARAALGLTEGQVDTLFEAAATS